MSDVRSISRPEAPPARIARAWLLVAIWAALVWWLGSEQFSARSTSRYLLLLIQWLFPDAPPGQHFTIMMTIRKIAHPSVYAVLAGLSFRAALVSGVSGLARGAAIALAIAISLAGLDEWRQSRTLTRTGAASDVMLDAAGASAALAALSQVRRRARLAADPSARPGGAP